MQRDHVHKGLLLRLVTDYSNIPLGTWATIDSIGTIRDGAWWFTVLWHQYRPISKRFPRDVIEYSITLWERDLSLFETVPAEEEEAANRMKSESPPSATLAPLPNLGGRWPGRRLNRNAAVHPNQLSLFLADDF